MITDSFQEKHALAVQFDSLNGEPLLVPSLKTIHPGWVLEKNPEYEKLGQHLTEWCNGYLHLVYTTPTTFLIFV